VRTIRMALLTLLVAWPALLAATSLTAGDDPVSQGREIFAEVSARNSGYGDQQASVTMQLRRKSGATTTRVMNMATLEVANDGARTIVSFNNPVDVKGTEVLTYTHSTADDEQWIYLPAFKRVKQISDANKTTSFMGSEFTYEDLNSLNIQLPKFDYRFLRTEELDGTPCQVVERVPRYARSAYKRQVVWVDRARSVVLKIEYYDTKDVLAKTLSLSKFQKYLGSQWRADEMSMVSASGDSTLLTWRDYKFKSGLALNDFSVSALKR
jgi:outer membrane lipoprotein-sorting protein